jgi:hypothetical protein
MMCVVYEPPGPKVWGERKRLVPRNGLARGRGSMTA